MTQCRDATSDTPKGGRKDHATKNNVVTKRRAVVSRKDMHAPAIRLTRAEVNQLHELRARMTKSTSKHPRYAKLKASRSGIIVDSGASRTMLKKQKWLKRLQRRIKLIVRNATGGRATADGRGEINLRAIDEDGSPVDLGCMGDGFLLPQLTYSLLSVSSICKQGFTVMFKPKGAWIITPGGVKVPLEEDEGLYFMPTLEEDGVEGCEYGLGVTTVVEVDEPTPQKTRKAERADRSTKVVARTTKALKSAGYNPLVARALGLEGDAVIAVMVASYAARKVHRLERNLRRAEKKVGHAHAMSSARAARAAKRSAAKEEDAEQAQPKQASGKSPDSRKKKKSKKSEDTDAGKRSRRKEKRSEDTKKAPKKKSKAKKAPRKKSKRSENTDTGKRSGRKKEKSEGTDTGKRPGKKASKKSKGSRKSEDTDTGKIPGRKEEETPQQESQDGFWVTVKADGKHKDRADASRKKRKKAKIAGGGASAATKSDPPAKGKSGKDTKTTGEITGEEHTVETDSGEALKLRRRLDRARDLLIETQEKLASAIERNVLERSERQAAAADRELSRVREWHRIHRLLNHASAKDTDAAYLSGKYRRPSDKDLSVFKKLPHHTEKYCSVCQRGKFVKRNKRIFQDKEKVRRVGEVWHGDLCGPFPESARGHKYMCTFTDAASGYMVVYTIAKKKEASNCFKKLYAFVEDAKVSTKPDHEIRTIKRLLTDRGGEFTSKIDGETMSRFNKAAKKRGVKQMFSSAYVSRHNGRAERTNRTVGEGMRCALIESGFKWSWWPEAAKYATFTANRVERVDAKGLSNYTRFTGLKSGGERLIPFGQHGQRALAKPKNKKGVLVKSEKVRMIGYPDNTKGYEVVDKDGKRHTLEHVEFAHARKPVKGGYTATEDNMVRAAIAPDPRKVDDSTDQPVDYGIIHARDDHELRASADRTDKELITFGRPIHHHEHGSDEPFDTPMPTVGKDGISEQAAEKAIQKFMRTKGKDRVLEWDAANKKSGKSKQRYEGYKHIRTHAEYCKAIDDKIIKGSKRSFKGGDLKNDLVKGYARIRKVVPGKESTAVATMIATKKSEKLRAREHGGNTKNKDRVISKGTREDTRGGNTKNKDYVIGKKAYHVISKDTRGGNTKNKDYVIGKKSKQSKASRTSSKRRTRHVKDLLLSMDLIEPEQAQSIIKKFDPEDPEIVKRINEGFDPHVRLSNTELKKWEKDAYFTMYSEGPAEDPLATHTIDTDEIAAAVARAATRNEYMAANIANCVVHAILPGNKTENHLANHEFCMAMHREIVCGKATPMTDAEARASQEWKEWRESIRSEQKALYDMGTFELVRRSEMEKLGRKPKGMKNVYKIKTKKDGSIERFKTRMVVQGFSLYPNNEYYDKYSSVMAPTSLRLMSYLAAQTGETISGADVGNAYLEAELDESELIFVEIHPDAEIKGYPRDEWVFRLKKCLYGLPQAGRGFQNMYNRMMYKLGFRRNLADDCLWSYHDESEGRIICGNYVDDLLCLTASEKLREWWRDGLRSTFNKVTFDDEADYMLGVKIERGVDQKGMRYVELDHSVAIEKVAKACLGAVDHKRPHHPMDHGVKLHKKREGEDDDSKYKPSYEYASVLGSIMYIANMTRPDLVTGVNKLSRYVANPSHTHYKALTKLVAFAYHSRDRRLRYTQVPMDVEHDPYRLHAASDSSYGDCPDSGRSTIGRCVWMGAKCNGLIDWKSQLPAQVAQNTTEAEVQAATECAKDILYYRQLLYSLGYPQKGSTRMRVDSTGAISQMNALSGVSTQRHYLVKLRKLQEVRHMGMVHPYRVDTKDNEADLFTKALPPMPFWRLGTRIMGDKELDHGYAEFRDEARRQEISGGRLKDIKSELSERSKHEHKELRKSEEMAGKRLRLETEGLQYQAHIASMEVMKLWLSKGGGASSSPQDMPSFASSVGGRVDDSGYCDNRGDLGSDTEERGEQTRASSGDNARR